VRTDEGAAAKAVADLSTMPYDALCQWAGADFERLLAVRAAKDYRPEWIGHQLCNFCIEPTPAQAATLDRMIADAGPFLSRRERWVLRHVKAKPTCIEALARLAKGAAEYRPYKDVARCVANDVARMVERGLIRMRDDVIDGAAEAGRPSAPAGVSVPRQSESSPRPRG
jgi:hypothetical protein